MILNSTFNEVLPKLKLLNAIFSLPPELASIFSSTRTAISTSSVTFFPSPSSPSPAIHCQLPIEINTHEASLNDIEGKNGCMLMKLRASIKRDLDDSVGDESETAENLHAHSRLHAENLGSLETIACHHCNTQIVLPLSACASPPSNGSVEATLKDMSMSTKRFKRVRDLPSQHWHELLDCWACHKEDYSHLRKGHIGSVIPARPREVFVGASNVMVDPTDLDMEAMEVEIDHDEKKKKEKESKIWLMSMDTLISSDFEIGVQIEESWPGKATDSKKLRRGIIGFDLPFLIELAIKIPFINFNKVEESDINKVDE
ncbi:hypothetical protein HDU97_006523 [Phlyctochytrium planicorne]|nr:hypothetical protein HDU97_006523 [Phlyctochytrium planicorne]